MIVPMFVDITNVAVVLSSGLFSDLRVSLIFLAWQGKKIREIFK